MILLSSCLLETAGYTTQTGSSWAGNVEHATFTLITEPFEKYLNSGGMQTASQEQQTPEEQQRPGNVPVQHPWWFRQVEPAGWQTIRTDSGMGGIRWQYANFKPREPITIRYYLMQVPRLPTEVDGWLDALLGFHALDELYKTAPTRKPAEELPILRQILLATYGQEPDNAVAKAFVQDQVWYHPQKDFSLAKLTKEQQAVLKERDRRIEAAGK